MRRSTIVFENLRAEMGRKNVTISEMAEKLGYNRDTLSRKLSGKSPINLDEAFAIQREFFDEVEVKVLFFELCKDSA